MIAPKPEDVAVGGNVKARAMIAPQTPFDPPLRVPRAIVEYYDTFRRTADGWRIASREYQYTFLKENN